MWNHETRALTPPRSPFYFFTFLLFYLRAVLFTSLPFYFFTFKQSFLLLYLFTFLHLKCNALAYCVQACADYARPMPPA